MSTRSTRASARKKKQPAASSGTPVKGAARDKTPPRVPSPRKRKQPAASSGSPVKDATGHKTPPRVSSPRKGQEEMDTPDWLSDLDIHLSPKTTSRSKPLASVKKSSPSKRPRNLYSFSSSNSQTSSDPEASPQKIGARAFYSAKAKGRYLTPLERKELREKLNKSADYAELAQNKSIPPIKNVKTVRITSTKKAAAKKPKTKSSTKKSTSKTKSIVKKTVKPVTKSPGNKTPKKTIKKTPSKTLPKKSPRRSVPKRSPWKATSAKKGIQMYMQSLHKGGKSASKSAAKEKIKELKLAERNEKELLGSSQCATPERKTPKKGQAEEQKTEVIRGLDFGSSIEEIDEEVQGIQQRIQDLIDTGFEEGDNEVFASTPKTVPGRKRKMKTAQQSLQGSESPNAKRQRVLSPVSSTPTKRGAPRKTDTPSKTGTPKRSGIPSKIGTPSKTGTPRKVGTPRKTGMLSKTDTPSKTGTPRKSGTPVKTKMPNKAVSPSKKSSTPSKPAAASSPRKSPARLGSTQKTTAKSPHKVIHPDTPESSSLTSQESPRNTLSKTKQQTRMFPVFTPPTSPSVMSTPPSRKRSPFLKKLVDKDGRQQLTLDVGQKRFGTTICKTCSMVYTLAHPEDEANHSKFHKKYLSYIKFPGWRNETVLQEFHDGRIILVTSDSPKYALKKIEEVRELVDHELGFLEGSSIVDKDSCKTLLFVTLDKKVAGCLIAEEINAGYRVIPDDPSQSSSQEEAKAKEQQRAWCCQTTPVRAVCGISRIWVAAPMRQKNIGRRMVDCIRNNFVYGSILSMDDIAFSDPTPDGKGFAIKYTGTPSFLVYKYKT